MSMHAGDLVEVRSKEEILALLDSNAQTEALPFMPEMLEFCGKQFRVYKSAHKTCDTIGETASRSLPNAVHLEGLRCSGAAHAGCQAACLLFWKTAWLKPVNGASGGADAPKSAGITEQQLAQSVFASNSRPDDVRYRCQATELPKYTSKLRFWEPGQYIEDLATGNVSLWQMLRTFTYVAWFIVARPNTKIWGAAFRWVYDRFQSLYGGLPFAARPGTVPDGTETPTIRLNLQAGELVRVKSLDEILATLDKTGRNRGMLFDPEMSPACGRTFRVKTRITTFIEEATGKLRKINSPTVMLENVWCHAHFSKTRLFCPRSIYSWWREIWLERVPEEAASQPSADPVARVSEPSRV